MPRMKNIFKFKAKVWVYAGQAGWHFVNVPKEESLKIKKLFGIMARGWGSLPVKVTVGQTSWQTSIFPDKKSGTYLLPLKAAARKAENIVEGDDISFLIRIII